MVNEKYVLEPPRAGAHSPPPPPGGGSCQRGPRRAAAASTAGLFKKPYTCGSLFAKCGCNNDDRDSDPSALHHSRPTKRLVPLFRVIKLILYFQNRPLHVIQHIPKRSYTILFNLHLTIPSLPSFSFFPFCQRFPKQLFNKSRKGTLKANLLQHCCLNWAIVWPSNF